MNTNAISAAAALASPQSTATAGARTDSNMFMTLLVAQLKNQDPLEPQDGTAFVAQLAQFNSLDNLIGIRQSMEQLVAAIHQQQTSPPSETPGPTTNPGPTQNPNTTIDN